MTAPAMCGKTPSELLENIRMGRALSDIDRSNVQRSLGVAGDGMIMGATPACTADDPCWPAVPKAGNSEFSKLRDDSGGGLQNQNSNGLLSKYAGGLGADSPRWMPEMAIRAALLAFNPSAFFYAYVSGNKLHALPTPADGSLPDVDNLDPPIPGKDKM